MNEQILRSMKSSYINKSVSFTDDEIEKVRRETETIIFNECKRYLLDLAKSWENREKLAERGLGGQ